jgi:hypothetical protein
MKMKKLLVFIIGSLVIGNAPAMGSGGFGEVVICDSDRIRKVEDLVKLSPQHIPEAVKSLVPIVMNANAVADDRIWAAEIVGKFGAEHIPQLAEVLFSIITNSDIYWYTMNTAAKLLVKFGAEYKIKTEESLLSLVMNSQADIYCRCEAARFLFMNFQLESKDNKTVEEVLFSIAMNQDASVPDRYYASSFLLEFVPKHEDEALKVLDFIATSSNAKFSGMAAMTINVHKHNNFW